MLTKIANQMLFMQNFAYPPIEAQSKLNRSLIEAQSKVNRRSIEGQSKVNRRSIEECVDNE